MGDFADTHLDAVLTLKAGMPAAWLPQTMGVFAQNLMLRDPLWDGVFDESLWLLKQGDFVYEVEDYTVRIYRAGRYQIRTLQFEKNGHDWEWDSKGKVNLTALLEASLRKDHIHVVALAGDELNGGDVVDMIRYLDEPKVLRKDLAAEVTTAGLIWAAAVRSAWLRTITM